MKDMYTFDIDKESAMETYAAVDSSYAKLFAGMFGHSNIARVAADTGNIGGDLSHEYHVLADEVGEDELRKCASCGNIANSELWLKDGAAGGECPSCGSNSGNFEAFRGVEVGHVFYLGDKYSKAMNATFTNAGGKEQLIVW